MSGESDPCPPPTQSPLVVSLNLPRPGEEQVIDDLFERYAADFALLLTYNGNEDVRMRRKVAAGPDRWSF